MRTEITDSNGVWTEAYRDARNTYYDKFLNKYPDEHKSMDSSEEVHFKKFVFKLLNLSQHPKREMVYEIAEFHSADYPYPGVIFGLMFDICYLMDIV